MTAGLRPGTLQRRMVPYARTADGSEASFPLIEFAGAEPGPLAVFTAGVHGDEYEAPAALWRLADTLDPRTLRGRLLIVPVANPPAFAAGTRTSPADGENLARIFPGDPGGTLSHRLADALMRHVVAGADLLVDCHSGGVRLAFVQVAGFYAAGDGVTPEAASRSLAVARAMGLAYLWQLPPVRGVLSYEAARRGIAVCGAEIGGRGACRQEDADEYEGALRSVLAHHGMIPAGPARPARAACLEGDWTRTDRGGYLETVAALGTRVARGALLARLRDPLGAVVAEFHAEQDGLVMGVRHLNTVQPGDLATCVARETTR